jgi:serine/threonine protein kinase
MYLHNYPQANRLEILRGIASGLSFLHGKHSSYSPKAAFIMLLGHTPQIVHGDLKPVSASSKYIVQGIDDPIAEQHIYQ